MRLLGKKLREVLDEEHVCYHVDFEGVNNRGEVKVRGGAFWIENPGGEEGHRERWARATGGVCDCTLLEYLGYLEGGGLDGFLVWGSGSA